jgi:hypothetical protein
MLWEVCSFLVQVYFWHICEAFPVSLFEVPGNSNVWFQYSLLLGEGYFGDRRFMSRSGIVKYNTFSVHNNVARYKQKMWRSLGCTIIKVCGWICVVVC